MTAVVLRSTVALDHGITRVTFYVHNPYSEFIGTELAWEYMGSASDTAAFRKVNRFSPILITVTGSGELPSFPQVAVQNMREAADFFGSLAILFLSRLNIAQDEAGLAAIAERIQADTEHAAPFMPPF